MDSDRRQYPRFKRSMSVIIHRQYNEKRIETADISLGGAAIYNAQRYYDFGQTLYIEIKLGNNESIFCDARVTSVYPHTKDSPTYQISLQFIDMPESDIEKLKNYIETD